jgi:hypothetical protein
MNSMQWIFSGIGTAFIVFLLGLGATRVIRRRAVKQRQKAGDNASQIQSGRDTNLGAK